VLLRVARADVDLFTCEAEGEGAGGHFADSRVAVRLQAKTRRMSGEGLPPPFSKVGYIKCGFFDERAVGVA
jgi:hypothetical protein